MEAFQFDWWAGVFAVDEDAEIFVGEFFGGEGCEISCEPENAIGAGGHPAGGFEVSWRVESCAVRAFAEVSAVVRASGEDALVFGAHAFEEGCGSDADGLGVCGAELFGGSSAAVEAEEFRVGFEVLFGRDKPMPGVVPATLLIFGFVADDPSLGGFVGVPFSAVPEAAVDRVAESGVVEGVGQCGCFE